MSDCEDCEECGGECFGAEFQSYIPRVKMECTKDHKHSVWHQVTCSKSKERARFFRAERGRVRAYFRDPVDDDVYPVKPNKLIIKRYRVWLREQLDLVKRAERKV